MLAQLLTVKARLAIDEFDLKYDSILTSAHHPRRGAGADPSPIFVIAHLIT
jgi:hypothetical protein